MLMKGNSEPRSGHSLDHAGGAPALCVDDDRAVPRMAPPAVAERGLKDNRFGVAVVDFTESYGGAFEIGLNLVKYANEIEPHSAALVSSQPPEYLNARVAGAFASCHLPMRAPRSRRGTS